MLRQLIADLFITVDGHASGRDAPAFFGYAGPDLNAWIDEQVARPQVIVMGANTYRVLAEVAASEADTNGSALTELPKVVFSRSLQAPLTWANTTLVADDVATAVPARNANTVTYSGSLAASASSAACSALGWSTGCD